jgi:hypothetical protein
VQDLKRLPLVAQTIRTAHHRDLDDRDALLASYPKSGNTWVRFMLGQLIAGREVTWDDLGDYVPMVNRSRTATARLPSGGRLLKTHDPCLRAYRTPGRRAVYLARDGRDVAVSYYHHQVAEGTFEGPFEAFLDRFLTGRADRFGSWPDNVSSWLSAAPPDTEVVRYEDVLADPVGRLDAMCRHLGLGVGRADVERVVADNQRERMRDKESSSSYLRERRADGTPFVRVTTNTTWRDYFGARERERFDTLCGDVMTQLGYEA